MANDTNIIGREEVKETNEKKLKSILDAMQGVTLREWEKLRQVIDANFKNEVAIQNAQIPMASPEKLMDSYKRLF